MSKESAIQEMKAVLVRCRTAENLPQEGWAIDCTKLISGTPCTGYLIPRANTEREARLIHIRLSEAFYEYAKETADERGVKPENVFVGSCPSLYKVTPRGSTFQVVERVA